jgi:Protein of unknown function (DUF2786)
MAEQTKTDRERAMERIQKCLRLSKSNEAHEAAAALRQAQKLMQQYSIEESELHGIEVKSVLVLTPEPPKTRFPMYLSAIASLICRAFDAQAIYEVGIGRNGQFRQGVRYFVAGGRAPLVEYAHEVIWRQLTQAWNDYRKARIGDSQLGERSSFWMGWIAAVSQKVMDFGATDKEKEVVGQKMTEFAGGSLKPAKQQTVARHTGATRAGFDAAGDFSLNRPVGGATQKMIGSDS